MTRTHCRRTSDVVTTKVNYMRDGGPVRMTPALRARVREIEARLLTRGGRLRRRPLREADCERTTLGPALSVRIELDREDDGRWIAQARKMGVLLYGRTKRDAVDRAVALTFEALADGIKAGEICAPASVAFTVTGPRAKR